MVISAKNLYNEYDGLQQNYDLRKTVTILVYQFPVLPPTLLHKSDFPCNKTTSP